MLHPEGLALPALIPVLADGSAEWGVEALIIVLAGPLLVPSKAGPGMKKVKTIIALRAARAAQYTPLR